MCALLQSAVAQLHKSKLQLHHLKHMLHLRTYARFGSILRPLRFVNPILVPVATMGVVLRARCEKGDSTKGIGIGNLSAALAMFERSYKRIPDLLPAFT